MYLLSNIIQSVFHWQDNFLTLYVNAVQHCKSLFCWQDNFPTLHVSALQHCKSLVLLARQFPNITCVCCPALYNLCFIGKKIPQHYMYLLSSLSLARQFPNIACICRPLFHWQDNFPTLPFRAVIYDCGFSSTVLIEFYPFNLVDHSILINWTSPVFF